MMTGAVVQAAEPPAQPTTPTASVSATTTTAPAAQSAATSPALGSDAAAVKWLRALEEKHRDHRRASGKFTQEKTDPIFLEKIKATGRFWYERPSNFRCDYDKPEASTSLVTGDQVTLYFPEFKQAERYRLSREGSGISEVNQMLLAFGIETDKVLKHFVVQHDPATSADIIRLTFTPRAKREDRPFAQFVLEIPKPDLPTQPEDQPYCRFEIKGDEGDRTVVVITEIKWNDPDMPADIFQLHLPRDVEIIE